MAKDLMNQEFEDTTPPTAEELLFNEADILKALNDKEYHTENTATILVGFGKTTFAFRIRPLSEKEWDACRERNTKYQKNRRLGGMRMPEKTDTTAYHTDLIYTTTVEEDRAKIWDNKNLWAPAKAITGRDMVDKLIPFAGKKQAIVDKIEKISGYDDEDEDELNESVKN